ncbi:hypothetical protein AB1M95_05465 [Sulfitobacter sp. LCG007]
MADEKEIRDDRVSDEALGAGGSVSQGGRQGGRLARDIGTRDELKRSQERPAGVTRVEKSDEED